MRNLGVDFYQTKRLDILKIIKWILSYTLLNVGFWGGWAVLIVLYLFTYQYTVYDSYWIYDLNLLFSDMINAIIFVVKFIFWGIVAVIWLWLGVMFIGVGSILK